MQDSNYKYSINFEDYRNYLEVIIRKRTEWEYARTIVNKGIQAMIADNKFSGQGAQAIKNYLTEVYGMIDYSIGQLMAEFFTRYNKYVSDYLAVDDDERAMFRRESMEKLCEYMAANRAKAEGIDSKLEKIEKSLAGVNLYFTRPSITAVIEEGDAVVSATEKLDEDINSYETSSLSSPQVDLAQFTAKIRTVLEEELAKTRSTSGYISGSVNNITGVSFLRDRVKASCEYTEQNSGDIMAEGSVANQVLEDILVEQQQNEGNIDTLFALTGIIGMVASPDITDVPGYIMELEKANRLINASMEDKVLTEEELRNIDNMLEADGIIGTGIDAATIFKDVTKGDFSSAADGYKGIVSDEADDSLQDYVNENVKLWVNGPSAKDAVSSTLMGGNSFWNEDQKNAFNNFGEETENA